MRFFRLSMLIFFLMAIAGCIRDFEPEIGEIPGLDKPLVVIEGDIIVGGITHVAVKTTRPVGSWQNTDITGNVVIWVESSRGEVWNGCEYSSGLDTSNYYLSGAKYMVDTRNLPHDGEYRLCVSIPDRGEYVSKFQPVLECPPIDSIWYDIDENRSEARINVATHDDTRDAGYYRWQFMETWNDKAIVPTELKYNYITDEIESLPYNEILKKNDCFVTWPSSSILLGNTEDLKVNRIFEATLQKIPRNEKKLLDTYCVAVVQMSLDKDGYVYWEQMKRNTSGNGGLFAPQPSEVNGNIMNATCPSEYVIGYVNVSTISVGKMYVDWRKERMFDKGQCEDRLTVSKGDWGKTALAGWVPLEVFWKKPETDKGEAVVSPVKMAVWVRDKCTSTGSSCKERPVDWPFVY